MVEVAFTVNKDSYLYQEYFDAKNERKKFHDLARAFFVKHDLLDSGEYYQCHTLSLKLSADQRSRFVDQLKKGKDPNGMSVFKKRSAMQKEWEDAVASKIDFDIISRYRTWFFVFISSGSYNMWDDGNGNVYGYLSDKYNESITLSGCMTEIKMSEYYAAIEALEAANK